MYHEADPDVLDKEFEEESEEIRRGTTLRHSLSRNELTALREASVEEIVEGDRDVELGMDLFFSNKVKDSEEVFEKHLKKDPLYASGVACISSIKAMLSMVQRDADVAIEKISYAINFAEELVPAGKSIFRRMGNIFKRDTSNKRLLPGEFRAKTILAESYALRGFVFLLQQNSLNSVLKGGLALNKSYNLFKTLLAELEEIKKEKETDSFDDIGLDRNSIYGVFLGCGCTNVVMSILPPRLLRILNFLGFTYDRDIGMQMIIKCWKSRTIFSSFAGLFLMTINSFLPGFCYTLIPLCLPIAKDAGEEAITRPPMDNSLIHLWLIGRIRRLERNIEESTSIFSKCLEVTEGGQVEQFMPQLRDLVLYDQAWNYTTALRWKESIPMYSQLEQKSAWSKMFYAYAQACCYEMLAFEAGEKGNIEDATKYREEASLAYWRASHYNVTVLGGKSITIERFVAVRLHEIFRQSAISYPNSGNKKKIAFASVSPPNGVMLRNTVPLPMLELFVLFDLLHQLPQSFLETYAKMISQVLGGDNVSLASSQYSDLEVVSDSYQSSEHNVNLDGYKNIVLSTLKATILSNMTEGKEDAKNYVKKYVKPSRAYKGKHCSVSWMAPQLMFELACMAFDEGEIKQSSKLFDKTRSINSNQIFHAVMDTKLHFAAYAFKHNKVIESKEGSEYKLTSDKDSLSKS